MQGKSTPGRIRTSVVDLLRFLDAALFSALALVAIRGWLRDRGAPRLWVAASFGILAVVTIVGLLLPETGGDLVGAIRHINIALLAVYPYALNRFAGAFSPPSRPVAWFTGAITTAVVLWSLLLPELPADGEPRTPAYIAFVIVFVAHFAVLSAIVAVRLWRAGRGQSAVVRRRVRLLAAGTVTLTAALFIAASFPDGNGALYIQFIAVGAALLFFAGFEPPTLLRAAWRQPEQVELRRGIEAMMGATSSHAIGDGMLPHIARVVGGTAAALVADDGTVLSTWRIDGDPFDLARIRPEGSGTPAPGDPRWNRADQTPIRVNFSGGSILVWTGPFTPLFGEEEIGLLRSVAVLVGLALDRGMLFERERAATKRLREVNQLKDEFVAIVAHDLRSPMTVISGFADTLLQRGDVLPLEQQRTLLEMISRNTRNLASLVEDVLQVARIEAGEFRYRIEPFQVGSLVHRTVAEQQAAHPDRAYYVHVAPRLPPAAGDEDRNWQVLTNLLSNAAKFSPAGEAIDVEVGTEEQLIRVAVRDRGPGIAADDMQKLFRKFSRLPPASSDAPKGTGLGLYICRSMVEAQGGTIDVTSRPGDGTTFMFTLPAAEESSP